VLSVAQASPAGAEPTPHRWIAPSAAVVVLFPPGKGTVGSSTPARRDRARPGPGGQCWENVPSILRPNYGWRLTIPDPPRTGAHQARAARLPRHRSNHRDFHRLRAWLPPTAIVQSPRLFRPASITEARLPAPANSFMNRSRPPPARMAAALWLALLGPPIPSRLLLFYRGRSAHVRNRKNLIRGTDSLSSAAPG